MNDIKDFTQLKFEGIDISGSLNRMMNNKELYIKMIIRFFGENVFEELEEKIRENDAYNARLKAHAIKGGAALLGFNMLSETAYAVEKIIDGRMFINDDCEEMQQLRKEYYLFKDRAEVIVQTSKNQN